MSCCLELDWKTKISIIIIILLLLKYFLPKLSIQIKIALLYVIIFSLSLISWPFMLFRPRDYRNLIIPYKVLEKLGEFLGFHVDVRGKENITSGHGCVVIINHQSVLDLLVLAYIYPIIGRVTIIVKKQLLYFPALGLVLWLSGFLFISRKKNSSGIDALNKESHAIQKQNAKIIVFPEGTRNLNKELLPFKKGGFHIAKQNQCPIQPVVISPFTFLQNSNKNSTNINRIIINIMEEIQTTNLNDDNFDEFIKDCRDLMQNECYKLTKELEKSESDKKLI